MSKAIRITVIGAVIIVGAFFVGRFYNNHLAGVGPAILPPKEDISDLFGNSNAQGEVAKTENDAIGIGPYIQNGPLTLPMGFSINIFAENLPKARVIAFDDNDNMWVSQTREGIITFIDFENGVIENQLTAFRNLNNPHGLAFDPIQKDLLYIAEEDAISRVPVDCIINKTPCNSQLEKIADLPEGGRHTTRTIAFDSDGKLYVSIGSACDTCHEDDPRRGTIQTVDPTTGALSEFARGLRNAVFFIWEADRIWATEMGRDFLGDNLPPDEINIVEGGKNYGWPICYGKNVHDTQFDKNTYIRNPCMEPFEIGSVIDIPAHSAPLGLAFVPQSSNWSETFNNQLLVAYHGSWNRTEPTGYKIALWTIEPENASDLEQKLLHEPPMEIDFITGWLADDNQALGRPVDLKFGPDGALYISDDKAGVIYRVTYDENEN